MVNNTWCSGCKVRVEGSAVVRDTAATGSLGTLCEFKPATWI